jgi:aspartyl/asparaginyl beta-hydroxylase (cupin superfamily)
MVIFNKIKLIYDFFRLWIKWRDRKEAWEDAKFINDKKIQFELNEVFENTQFPPCNFDHNGECLICDCWRSDCAYIRYLKKDYKWETKEELEEMFKNISK